MTRRCFVALSGCCPLLLAGSVDDARKKIKDGNFEAAITSLEAELKKNPRNSNEIKLVLSEAYLANGEKVMYDKELPPFRKYPTALKNFRKAVEYDAKNLKAKDHINTIEAIYKSMGRPVPQ